MSRGMSVLPPGWANKWFAISLPKIWFTCAAKGRKLVYYFALKTNRTGFGIIICFELIQIAMYA